MGTMVPDPIASIADNKLCFRAQAELVCIVNGRLSGSEDYDRAFAPYIR